MLAEIGGEPTHGRDLLFRQKASRRNTNKQFDQAATLAQREGEFDPKNDRDARTKVTRAITLRRGRPAFRRKLLEAYSDCCALTGCDCPDVLEAAHIRPYRGERTDYTQNGILLRSDIHTLFDIGQLGFAPGSYKVILSKSLKATVYGKLKGKKLRPPSRLDNRPSDGALRRHLANFGLKAPGKA